MTRYLFDLVCPYCGKGAVTTDDKRVPPPRVQCGDCLMERTEIVEMKAVRVKELPGADKGMV
jgi:ribosomal protein S27AE